MNKINFVSTDEKSITILNINYNRYCRGNYKSKNGITVSYDFAYKTIYSSHSGIIQIGYETALHKTISFNSKYEKDAFEMALNDFNENHTPVLPELYTINDVYRKQNINDHIVIYPGSFNPYHIGHMHITQKVRELTNVEPVHEISLLNADKGCHNYWDVLNRIVTLQKDNLSGIITTTSTFGEKITFWSTKHKKQTYVVGIDTWDRIWKPHYYNLDDLKSLITKNNVDFHVFSRNDEKFNDYGIAQVSYHDDNPHKNVSSSQIRNGQPDCLNT